MLLFAIAVTTVILTRALMLGGIPYALGIGLEDAYATSLVPNLLRLGTRARSTWLFLSLTVGTSFGILLIQGRQGDSPALRLCFACVAVAVVCVLFGHFQETRVFAPLIPITLNAVVAAWPGPRPAEAVRADHAESAVH